MIPDEPLDLVDQVVSDYRHRNPGIVDAKLHDPTLAAAWHMTVELAQTADAQLRAWRVPHQQRRQMTMAMIEQMFGTPAGRHGAEMAAQLAAVERRDRDSRTLMEIMVKPSAAEATVGDQLWRYGDGQWNAVDTPADSA